MNTYCGTCGESFDSLFGAKQAHICERANTEPAWCEECGAELTKSGRCDNDHDEEERESFEHALHAFVLACGDISDTHTVRHYPNVPLSTFDIESGRVYTRIVCAHAGSRSVHAFVRNSDGAILYPKGWRGPQTKGKTPVRGSIYAPDHGASAMGPYGVKAQR